jgi:hypothetical protein
MKIVFRIIVGIILLLWIVFGLILHGLVYSFFNDKEIALTIFCLILSLAWWGISVLIARVLVEWHKESKQERKAAEYKKKYLSDVEIENSYFGNGILVKDSGSETIIYKDIKSGFDRLFDSFGKKSDDPCDLYEFIVEEDNIDYVLASLEKIYKKSDQIMEECYDEIYKELVEFLEDCDILKDDFDLAYLKENWYVYGIAIYDEYVEFTLGIDAAKDPEADSNYNISIFVDYSTQEPNASFNVVW